MFATALLAALLLLSPLQTEVAPGVDCPGLEAIERSLGERRIDPGGSGWRLTLEVGQDEAADEPSGGPSALVLRLRLHQPAGELVLERLMTVERDRCETAAEAIALVVERYFRELSWTSGAPAVRAPTPPPAAPSLRETVSREVPRPARVIALLGPAWWTRRPSPLAAAAELRVRVAGPVHVGLGFLFPGATAAEELPGGGGATLRSWPFLLRALAEKRRGLLAAAAGLDALVSVEGGRSSGIPQPAARRRVMLAAGASLGLAWLPTPRLRVAVEVGAARALVGNDFVVGGYGRVLAPPAWQGLAALRLGWAIWP